MSARIPEQGPFDIIGDVHGCYDELRALLERLGYHVRQHGHDVALSHPQGRTVVFVGDLVDRGPKVAEVLQLAMAGAASGAAFSVAGNHDDKLVRKLRGRNVKIAHGLAESLEQLERQPAEFRARVARYLERLPPHFVLDSGRLVIAHAGLREDLHGSRSGAARAFCLYGQSTGATDEFGLPVRYDWARDYRGEALVVYGHTPVQEAVWINNTICIDTGCVFGGKLTALRYPERELVSVPAQRVYYAASRPFRQP